MSLSLSLSLSLSHTHTHTHKRGGRSENVFVDWVGKAVIWAISREVLMSSSAYRQQ
ncbi:hypothetical protein KP509_01G043400 [Ceratopteris richardii]|uniref:Uncharacterized protein n=1 Tax=Ceratopteris richardii TaxID=49495 RepID=A0A8T2VNZ5_CERRI|nr:hypothetical protein KP509_01G043400 [Ceratopteris richardii]